MVFIMKKILTKNSNEVINLDGNEEVMSKTLTDMRNAKIDSLPSSDEESKMILRMAREFEPYADDGEFDSDLNIYERLKNLIELIDFVSMEDYLAEEIVQDYLKIPFDEDNECPMCRMKSMYTAFLFAVAEYLRDILDKATPSLDKVMGMGESVKGELLTLGEDFNSKIKQLGNTFSEYQSDLKQMLS